MPSSRPQHSFIRVRSAHRQLFPWQRGLQPRWIRSANGQPFVLNLDRLEPELRKRAPAAYLGN
jgi:hypothetical protein